MEKMSKNEGGKGIGNDRKVRGKMSKNVAHEISDAYEIII